MSSTDNLISLLSQLQMMEATVTDFLMETVLRFQTLIDAKVFLMVERVGMEPKRRYCGSRDLIHHFEVGGLCHQPTDLEVELEANARILVDRPRNKRRRNGEVVSDFTAWSAACGGGATAAADANADFNEGFDVSAPTLTRMRDSDADRSRFDASPPKMIRLGDSSIDQSRISEKNSALPEIPSEKRVLRHASSARVDVKNEVDECVVIEDDDDDYDNVMEEVDASELFEDVKPLVERSESNHSQPPLLAMHGISGEEIIDKILKRERSDSEESASRFFDRLKAPGLQERKLVAILATENPYAAYVKRTVEYKVWRSVLYQVGKNIALKSPFVDKSLKNDAARDYFSDQCLVFMRHCAPLLVDKDRRPEVEIPENDCLRMASVVGFIKHSIRHGYLYGCTLTPK